MKEDHKEKQLTTLTMGEIRYFRKRDPRHLNRKEDNRINVQGEMYWNRNYRKGQPGETTYGHSDWNNHPSRKTEYRHVDIEDVKAR